jgi:hypothetical protein
MTHDGNCVICGVPVVLWRRDAWYEGGSRASERDRVYDGVAALDATTAGTTTLPFTVSTSLRRSTVVVQTIPPPRANNQHGTSPEEEHCHQPTWQPHHAPKAPIQLSHDARRTPLPSLPSCPLGQVSSTPSKPSSSTSGFRRASQLRIPAF